MKQSHLVAAAIALALVGTSVQADPLPDSLSLGGVTLYGTIDIGYAYQNHGVPQNSLLPGGLEYQAFTTTRNFAGSVSTVAQSGIEQSRIGVRVLEPIVGDWKLIGAVDSGFNPLSGHFTDACGSFVSNGGLKQGQQTANADSSRCGQVFNNFAFGGISNPKFGALTIGRQQALQLEQLAVYDPQALSYAFSFLGYSGFNGGAGSTQAARWDNSVKYALQADPIHLAIMYSPGAQDGGLFDKSFAADLGVVIAGLSVDGTYENAKGAVNLRSSFNDVTNPVPTPGLSAFISDNTSWNLMGKYVFSLANKDKLTAYAGYTHIEKSHYTYTVGTSQGAYPIVVPINVNAPAYYNMEWVGGRYAFSSGLNLVAAYYHITQNSWTVGRGTTGTDNIGCATAGLLCAGDFNEVSFVVDYIFNKHYDLYVGVNWSEVTDGLANGFSGTTANGTTGSESQTTLMFGGRIKF